MSDMLPMEPREPGHRRAAKRRSGCLPMLAVLLVVVVGIGAAVNFVVLPWWEDNNPFAAAEDYPGPGEGRVTFVIEPGQSIPSMGEALEEAGIVASAEAFVDAASGDDRATGIQAGTYQLRREMKASDVLEVLVDPTSIARDCTAKNGQLAVPEGMRTDAVVELLAEKTRFSAKKYEKALRQTGQLGLPDYANGDPEGYLYPGCYQVEGDGVTAASILRSMVERWQERADALQLESRAEEVGLTPAEVMTVASILEFEAQNAPDYRKVARAIYNRLDDGMKLQSDATVAYANGLEGRIFTTDEERALDSPYNTYLYAGLPPGPIANPSDVTIEAALDPADGDWLFWVVVDLDTGKTVFSDTYEQHLVAVERFREWCRQNEGRCL